MIYIKQYNSLFDSPFAESQVSRIEVIGYPDWQDLQEVIEGVDYEIRKQVDKEIWSRNSHSSFAQEVEYTFAIPITPKLDDVATERLNEAADLYDFAPGERDEDIFHEGLMLMEDDLVPGVREEDSLASDTTKTETL